MTSFAIYKHSFSYTARATYESEIVEMPNILIGATGSVACIKLPEVIQKLNDLKEVSVDLQCNNIHTSPLNEVSYICVYILTNLLLCNIGIPYFIESSHLFII